MPQAGGNIAEQANLQQLPIQLIGAQMHVGIEIAIPAVRTHARRYTATLVGLLDDTRQLGA